MRPVLLEMAGFASFREPTTVDFRHAEYFALVGPTGSGKSTVIDAITFALYGSVPRWDNPRTVALALAPTVGRGTVRFVFDAGGERFVVARELRRAASGGVSVRTARLERLRDREGTGAADEETEPLAEGAAGTTRAVEELLGLPFGDFTTCVVLPQGAFAEFLHTEPRKRQETLVRLLGLGVYDTVAREANTEAKAQDERARVLTEQLGGYADATADAEQDATARVDALTALRQRVLVASEELAAATAGLASIAARVAGVESERGLLDGLVRPDGVDALAEGRRARAAALATAEGEAGTAEAADTAARESLAAAPEREPLQRARRHHAELAEAVAALPAARERHARSRDEDEAAAKEAAIARLAVETARGARDAAAADLAAAREAGLRLAAERDALRAPAAPADLDHFAAHRAARAAALDAVRAALAEAERADALARSAAAAAPPAAPLEQARRDVSDLDAARAALAGARSAREQADRDAAPTAGALATAAERLTAAREVRAVSLRADLAAGLRPALVAGEHCPVCAQRVATLPEPLPAADLAAADRGLAAAEQAHDLARRDEAAATMAASRAGAAVDAASAAVARLEEALTAPALRAALAAARPPPPRSGSGVASLPPDDSEATPLPDEGGRVPTAGQIDAALGRLRALAEAARAADEALRRARSELDAATGEAEFARAAAAAAGRALRTARDPLVPLGAPPVEDPDTDPAAAWAGFLAWAAGAAQEREDALPAAREAHTRARDVQATAERALTTAEGQAEELRRAETAAARAEQEARGTLARLEVRERDLTTALREAPPAPEVEAHLARIGELDAAVRHADGALRAARAAVRTAEREAAAVERETAEAWTAMRSARDPLVPLGAPAAVGDDLAAAWAELTAWATAAAADRAARLDVARSEHAAAREHRDGLGAVLATDLAERGVAPDPGRGAVPGRDERSGTAGGRDGAAVEAVVVEPAEARRLVDVALERATAARERVVERRAAVASLAGERDTAVEAAQVARLLGQMLRSDGFPRWLVASALDTLVADASATLVELSGGQFELTHAAGEFLVVDHADADARRPVKTLSGGETFQASLALALALSAQMSALAAHGAARLESIFLDEGFGTLDEANLETVASTLETLAAHGDRVVGVITHVAALAERVPVRFGVQRDALTSTITRESP